MTNWTPIQTSASEQIAHVWRSHLEAEGIASQIIPKSNSALGVEISGMLDPTRAFELWVHSDDAARALALLNNQESAA